MIDVDAEGRLARLRERTEILALLDRGSGGDREALGELRAWVQEAVAERSLASEEK